MTLSSKLQKMIKIAIPDSSASAEFIAALEAELSTAAADVAAVAQADAATQTVSYVQADVQSIADLANANKVAINDILSSLKAAGLML